MKKVLYFLCVIVAVSEAKLPLPKEIHACSRSDPNLNECFATNGNLAMSYIAKGDPNYNICTLLPLKWQKELMMKVPPIKLTLKDIVIYGVENFTISDAHIDLNQKTMQFILSNNHFYWRAQYNAGIGHSGNHETIDGEGTIIFRDGKWNMTFEYDMINVDGIEYANITKGYGKYIDIDLEFDMGDLDTNPKFHDAWNNVKKPIFISQKVESSAGETTAAFFNKILNVVPFDKVFTP